MWNKAVYPAAFILFALLSLPGIAVEKIDLDRITPVPADQPIPTQDFFRPHALAQPRINRAGTHIAAITTLDEDKHILLIYEISTSKVKSLGGSEEKDIYNVRWLNNSRVLFQLTSRKLYGLGIMAADIDDLKHAYPLQQYQGSSVVSIPLKDPLSPLVWNRHDIETRKDVGVAALNSNIQSVSFVDLVASASDYDTMQLYSKTKENNRRSTLRNYPIPETTGLTYHYMADKEGELAYSFTSDHGNLSLFRLNGKEWVKCPVDLEQIDAISNANEPGQLFVRGPQVDNKPRPLQLMDAATGQLGAVILEDPQYDFNGWIYHNPANGDALGAIFEKGGPRVYWFNEQYSSLQKILDGMFPGQVARIIDSDEHHGMFLVATFSDRQPVVYHWVNLATRKAGIFKQSAPWIEAGRMQAMQITQLKTRDGKKIDAYLTLPAGASKTNPAPLVVLCHGGPWARDNWGFDGEVQFLAHHGYAVLQPNYRGSTGTTGRFPIGDQYEFVKMHDDVTDAVKAILGTGLIDRDRVAIMGGSFGGYLAVSGVAHEPDLYRCAVTNAGVFDWALQVQTEKTDQYELPYYGRMVKMLGDPKVETAKYEAMSPLRFAQNIRVPVFIAGGKEDRTVEIGQSEKLIGALEKNHIPYEKFFVGGEAHGLAYLKNQVELYDRILAFLDRYLKTKS